MSHTHPVKPKKLSMKKIILSVVFHCKSEIVGKPWISVACGKDDVVHACNYICSNRLGFYIGSGYWDRVLNKEDFPGPRPVIQTTAPEDITVTLELKKICREKLKKKIGWIC